MHHLLFIQVNCRAFNKNASGKLTLVDPDKRNLQTAAERIAALDPLEAAFRQLLPQVQLESKDDLTCLLTANIPPMRKPVKPDLPFTLHRHQPFPFRQPDEAGAVGAAASPL